MQLLRTALQKVGEESDQLKYRDSVARRRHAYYPYYEWAQARLSQARGQASIYTQRDLLQDAAGRLGQTRHPEAAKLLEEVNARLAEAEKSISMDSSFSAVKTRIEVLGTGERFVEALGQLDSATAVYKTRAKEMAEVRTSLLERQAVVVKRYDQLMVQRLADVAVMDPATAADSIVPLLQPALVPPEVIEKGGPSFEWLGKFIELWKTHGDHVRRAAELPGTEVIAAAGKLESAALEALALNVPAGFRAARHMAQAACLIKLRGIATGSDDVFDLPTTEAVLRSADEAAARAGAGVVRRGGQDDTRTTLENDLASQRRQVAELGQKIQEGSKERNRLTAPILRAEEALADGETIGATAALEKLKNDLFELESEATFGTLTARLRARALFAHALAEAMLAFLEGNLPARVVDRCRLPAWRAYGFDGAVDGRWSPRLSPKLLKVFEQIKPQ